MKRKPRLDAYEKSIENSVESLVPVTGDERQRINAIVDKARKNSSISLRMSNYDLEKIKEKARKGGLPYQTLITSVLRRYVNEEFYDRREVLKTLKILRAGI